MRWVYFVFFLSFTFCIAFSRPSSAQPEGYEPTQSNAGDYADVSPKQPWGDLNATQDNGGSPWWADVILWIPNRILDFIDVFRVDVGVGPAAGGVVRVTEYGQLGYRQMMPFSVRVGDFGRQFPAMIEQSNEIGAGPTFLQSRDRSVCSGEVGLGADLFIVGGYAGICVDELADFLAGLVFIDLKDDDLDS